jgi:nucleotide-binding universal stress UspA family protein
MIQDLLLPITGTPGDDNALEAAIALAAHLDAHLAVLDSTNLPMPFPPAWGMAPSELMAQAYDDLEARQNANAERLRTRLRKEVIAWELRTPESLLVEPPQLMALHARYADLTVVAAPDPQADDDTLARSCFSALLFESGRPILVIPARHSPTLPLRHIVVAWQPTRESTRALHDALPLLARAASVDLVIVDPAVSELRHGEDPGADIATHLSRHDLKVNVVALPSGGATVAAALLRHAAESGAQCLVAGGYGHSRLREWMLGGTTRELLQAPTLPILFSH